MYSNKNMVNLQLPWLQEPGFGVLFMLMNLLPTLEHVINVNSQKKFHRTMNETESDAQASSFFFQRQINSDHLHSAAIIRCKWAQMRENA